MPAIDAGKKTICIARQPILDRRGEVFGYELLSRERALVDRCTVRGDGASGPGDFLLGPWGTLSVVMLDLDGQV